MLQDIISKERVNFAEGVQTVLRGHENRSRGVALLKGNLVQNTRSESRGISARVTKDGHYGFSSVASYTEKDAEMVLRAATENAIFLSQRAKAPRKTYPAQIPGAIITPKPVIDIEQKKFIDACRTIDDYVAGKYPDLLSRKVVEYTPLEQDGSLL